MHLHLEADVSDAASVSSAISAAAGSLGGFTAAINCAGVEGSRARLHDYDDATFDRVMAVNVRGVYLSMKHEVRQMLATGRGGAIVNIASTAGTAPFPEFTPYCASKYAVVGSECTNDCLVTYVVCVACFSSTNPLSRPLLSVLRPQ